MRYEGFYLDFHFHYDGGQLPAPGHSDHIDPEADQKYVSSVRALLSAICDAFGHDGTDDLLDHGPPGLRGDGDGGGVRDGVVHLQSVPVGVSRLPRGVCVLPVLISMRRTPRGRRENRF